MSVTSKRTIIGFCTLVSVAALFLVYTLAGLGSSPVSYAEPPMFVTQFVTDNYGPTPPSALSDAATAKLTTDYFNEAAMVRNVIVNGESPDELIRLFTHSDRAKRVKIAFAFGEVNLKLSHDEGTGFDDKRDLFWAKVEPYSAAIQNALFEALIVSAQERTRNFIPYTLAWWMQDDKLKAVDMLTWAAKHHPDTWVRNFSVYYVVQFGENEEHAAAIIQDRTHDPVFRVRSQVLEQRVRRFKETLFGKEE